MIYGLVILLLGYFISTQISQAVFRQNTEYASRTFISKLYWYHTFLAIVYYIYVTFNPSDSKAYYSYVLTNRKGASWQDYYGTSTEFIEWVGYPFIHGLSFNYEAMMALFSLFGFIGFIFFYKFFKERIKFNITWKGYNGLAIIFLLPNLHFWSGSFGKGSLIFMGLGLLFYALNKPNRRIPSLLFGALITYHVRPHVMLVILVSALIAFIFSTQGVSTITRIAMIVVCVVALAYIYNDVLTMVGIEQGEELTEGLDLTKRAVELQKATSGVDITSYSLPLQVFTFLFRPLFFDAPGMLGIIVSFENVFLLAITIVFFWNGGLMYILKGDFLVKTAFISFITVSIALAQISGNLGLAIRQKSQVMLLFLFVIFSMFNDQKLREYKRQWLAWKRRQTMTSK